MPFEYLSHCYAWWYRFATATMKPVDEVAGDAMSLLVTAGRKLRSVSLAAARITATVALLAGFESAVPQDPSTEMGFLIYLKQLSEVLYLLNPRLLVGGEVPLNRLGKKVIMIFS